MSKDFKIFYFLKPGKIVLPKSDILQISVVVGSGRIVKKQKLPTPFDLHQCKARKGKSDV